MSQQTNRTFLPPVNSSASRGGVIFFGALLAAVLLTVLFPWFPGGLTLDVGTTVERDIVAPRAVSYESAVLTEQLREDRAAEVPDQPVLDTDIRDNQLAGLAGIIAELDSIRGDPTLSASARETAIRAIPNGGLSQRAASTIVAAAPAQWRALVDEARNALGRTLAGAISEDEVDAARSKAAGLLSPLLTADHVIALRELVDPLIVPTLTIDHEYTDLLREEARANTRPISKDFARGQIVVEGLTVLSMADVEALDQLGLRQTGVDTRQVVATALIAVLSGTVIAGYLLVVRPPAVRGARRMVLLGLLLVVPAAAAKFVLPMVSPDLERHFLVHALPLAAGPIAAAVLLDITSAILLAAVLAASVAFSSTYLPGLDAGGAAAQLETARFTVGTLSGSLAGVFVASRADRLQRFLTAGFAAAAASLLAVVPFWLIDLDAGFVDLIWIVGSVAASGLLIALIGVGAFVLLSRPFGIITRVELMELAQLSQPLLRRLQDEAPGTFQHSILVGNLAERAADRIGADPLLARVGAYYHDIGKLASPSFFIENIGSDESPHEGLDSLQSTRVILQHVSGGVEMGRRAGLPEVLIQFIQQHHGTRLVSFFYRRASEVNADIDPELFRYAGPKPQSREAVLVMLADSCEAATRASSDHSAERIRQIVTQMFRERMDENEFDESPISLRDLGSVREAYISTLTAVFHPRVEYPDPTVRELEARGRDAEIETVPSRPAMSQSSIGPRPVSTPLRPADTVQIDPPEPRRSSVVERAQSTQELNEDNS
jgi:putative nucleotidyltransferase with HDIG domain